MLNYDSSGIQGFLDQVKSTVTQLSGTGVAVIQARQQIRNQMADARNQDQYNIRIANTSSPNVQTDVLRAERDALNASGGKGATIPGQSATWLLIAGAAVLAWMAFK